ncbi:TonB-dependent receptor [Vreelandella aquamarina]
MMSYPTSAFAGLAFFTLAAIPQAVQAQSTSSAENATLDPVVVTATLAPRTANESLASVSVIDEAALRRQDPISITEVFRGQPGVDITTQGTYGKQTSLFMRGTGSNANVLLIDGIRLRSATTGAASWEFLDPRMFESAEIVRGPRGSLYGADAVGGVIQLFTPDSQAQGVSPRVSIGGGSHGSKRVSASLSGQQGGTRYTFAGSRFDTDGGPVRRDGEDKSFDATSGLVKLLHRYDNDAEVGLLALRSRGNSEFEGPGPAEDDFVQQVAGVYAELPVTDSWQSRLILSEARDERDTQAPTYTSLFESRTRTAQWLNTLAFGLHEVIIGAEMAEDDLGDSETSGLNFNENSRYNRAAFAQGLLDFDPLTTQLSLRYDDNEAFGDEVTGSLAFGFAFDDQHVARASYGTAFRAPTFNELYFPFVGSSNPNLNAESSNTFELGVRGQYERWFWDAAIYQTEVDELIALDANFTPVNVDKARIQGAELSLGAELGSWLFAGALTYTDPQSRSGDNQGKRLQRRASQSARLDVDYQLDEVLLGGSWVVQDHRYNDAANQQRLPGYGLLNLRAGWEFAPQWSLRLTLDNLLDNTFTTAQGQEFDPVSFASTSFDYINAGRAGFLSVHYGQ